MNRLSILYRSFTNGKILIRNRELPICSTCINFIEHKNNYPYDPIPSDEKYGRCKKFGEVNLVSGKIEYDLAKHCRLDNNKCGTSGSEYKDNIESYEYLKVI